MADNRKYYYLKLKENFFDSDSIVLLEDMKDGILILSRLVDTFFSRILYPMLPLSGNHSIAVV